MVYGRSETVVSGVTLSPPALPVLLPTCVTVQASRELGAESCLGAAGTALTG